MDVGKTARGFAAKWVGDAYGAMCGSYGCPTHAPEFEVMVESLIALLREVERDAVRRCYYLAHGRQPWNSIRAEFPQHFEESGDDHV